MADDLETAPPKPAALFDKLTKRERQVAIALASGLSNSEIAEAANMALKTVSSHRGAALAKLGCRNNVELARLAIREGVVAAP